MKVTNYLVSYGWQKNEAPFFGSALGYTYFKLTESRALNQRTIEDLKGLIANINKVEKEKVVIISITKLNKEEVSDEECSKYEEYVEYTKEDYDEEHYDERHDR